MIVPWDDVPTVEIPRQSMRELMEEWRRKLAEGTQEVPLPEIDEEET